MKNIELHANELEKTGIQFAVVEGNVVSCKEQCEECLFTCGGCKYSRMSWLLQETSILNDVEKSYIKAIIKPFKARVTYIIKKHFDKWEYLVIYYDDLNHLIGHIALPNFIEGSMYKDMELNKEYTREDLGL